MLDCTTTNVHLCFSESAIAESFAARYVPDSLHLHTNIIAVDVSVRRPSSVYNTRTQANALTINTSPYYVLYVRVVAFETYVGYVTKTMFINSVY